MKQCTKCRIWKPLEEFTRATHRSDGKRSWCRGCDAIASALHRKNHPEAARDRMRRWRKNNPEKDAAARLRRKEENPDYYKIWRKANPRKKRLIFVVVEEKKCPRCGVVKKVSDFSVDRTTKCGFRSHCKTCAATGAREWQVKNQKAVKKYESEYRSKNKARLKKYRKELYARNRDRDIEYVKQWKAEHPENVREWRRKKDAKRRATPRGKLNQSVATRMRESLNGKKCGRHWETLVGYTVDQLKVHLEKQFSPEMTWENYGTYWQIDHKTPLSVFNYENLEDTDFRLCWNLKNLQPLEAIKNRIKGAKLKRPFQPSLTI